MPLNDGLYGKNADGSQNSEYCKYCFPDEKFSRQMTMEEMIESCIPFMLEDGECKTEEEARKILLNQIPNLKRWKK